MKSKEKKYFILLAHARSGSTLISQALCKHPNIIMCDELFHADPEERKGQLDPNDPMRVLHRLDDYYRDGEDPMTFLEKTFFSKQWPEERTAIGFKLFHPHVRKTRLWDDLQKRKDLDVIQLHRRSLLNTYTSRAVARVTGIWEKPADKTVSTPLKQVHIDVEDLLHYITEMKAYWDEARQRFKEHHWIEFCYETDLFPNHQQETFAAAQKHLGVPVIDLPVMLKKQSTRTAKEQIENYDAVIEALGKAKLEWAI